MWASELIPFNAVNLGYPKLDEYAKQLSDVVIPDKLIANNKPYVIYAPHWSIVKSHAKVGTFNLYYKKFFELMNANPGINFVLKPHPHLPVAIRRANKADEDIGITYKEYNTFCEDWNNAPNGLFYQDDEFIDLFRGASCLITDCISFISEWLPTEKPCIFMINPATYSYRKYFKRFLQCGQEALRTYYGTDSWPKIKTAFYKIMIDGIDEKKEARIALVKQEFHNLGNSGNSIVTYIENKLRGKI